MPTKKKRQKKNKKINHDMFLLNVKMQMENQGPIPTHSYGYQD